MVSLKEALRQIDKMDYRDTSDHFQIAFLTCNRHKETGGELITLDKANRCGLPPNCKDLNMRGIKCAETGKKYAVHNRLIFSFQHNDIYWV